MIANLIYLLAVGLLSPWILYRRIRHGRYRRGWKQKFWGLSGHEARLLSVHRDDPNCLAPNRFDSERDLQGCLWLHAVSVGEVNLLPGVIGRLEERFPDTPIVVSTSTDTGYDLAVQKFGADRVFFCPLDFTWSVRRTLKNLNPRMLVLAELELWPNLIQAARQHGTEVVVINGRLSDRSAAGYQRFAWLTKPIFQSLNAVLCQDTASAKRFNQCGTPEDRIQVTGSLKFDDAPSGRENLEVQSRSRWAGMDAWQIAWVVGSTQEGEEQMALNVYDRLRKLHPELRLILVPRHPERFNRVRDLIQRQGLTPHCRSVDGSQQNLQWTQDRVILIDTIGELRHWWGVGQIATVGGSFGNRGGQNMLEPAGYGLAVSFGPNTKNFADISRRLLDAGGAAVVQDEAGLERFVSRCLQDRPAADALGRAAKQMIAQHLGATDRTVEAIETRIAPRQSSFDQKQFAA